MRRFVTQKLFRANLVLQMCHPKEILRSGRQTPEGGIDGFSKFAAFVASLKKLWAGQEPPSDAHHPWMPRNPWPEELLSINSRAEEFLG